MVLLSAVWHQLLSRQSSFQLCQCWESRPGFSQKHHYHRSSHQVKLFQRLAMTTFRLWYPDWSLAIGSTWYFSFIRRLHTCISLVATFKESSIAMVEAA